MFARLFAALGFSPKSVSDRILQLIANQYELRVNEVSLDRPLREFGKENGLDDEFNFVEILVQIEKRWHISLPDGQVIFKEKIGPETIPADLTPRRLIAIVERIVSAV